MKRNICLWIVLMSFFSTVVCAQTPLTFEQAVEKAFSENPSIRASEYGRLAAEQERKAAFGLRLPQVGVTGAYIRMGEDIGIDLNPLKQPASDILGMIVGSGAQLPPAALEQAQALLGQNWGYTIQERGFGFVGGNVTLPIYAGGKINAANRAARINERSAFEKERQIRHSLLSELVERYYGLSLAIEAVKVRGQVHRAMLEHLSDACALEQNGLIARSERLYMELKAAEAERDLMAARLNERTLRDALANTLHENGEYIPVSPMFMLSSLPETDYFREQAVQRNPQLKQAALGRALAVEGVKVQRAGFFPQVAAIGGASLYRHRMNGLMPDWAIGIGVKFDLFDGLNREHKYIAAQYTVRQVESLGVKAESDISTLIGKLYNELENYRDRVRAVEASLAFSEEYLRVQRIAFREGAASASDVTDAELNLAASRIERLQTAYYYGVMLARLLEAAGLDDAFVDYARSAEAIYVE